MPYIHEIFKKATIRSVADYLLFGLGPDEDTRDYEERLDELYNKFEEAVRKYDSNPTSELLDLSNELTSETASVYTEIGLQLGMLLCLDMANNCRQTEELSERIAGKENGAKSILEKLYQIQEVSDLQETLIKDKEYQKAQQEVKECVAPLKKYSLRISCGNCLKKLRIKPECTGEQHMSRDFTMRFIYLICSNRIGKPPILLFVLFR